jgi:hypothetical protein
MSEFGDVMKALKREKQAERAESRAEAWDEFGEAQRLAVKAGLVLRRCTEAQYQLYVDGGWLLNIYPGNGRLYSDPNRRGPFLKVPMIWSLLDVVRAAIAAEQKAKGGAT